MERSGDESRGWGGTSRTTVLNAMLVMLSLASPGVTAALTAELVVLIAFAVGWFLSGAEPEGREVYPFNLTAGAGDGRTERRRDAWASPA